MFVLKLFGIFLKTGHIDQQLSLRISSWGDSHHQFPIQWFKELHHRHVHNKNNKLKTWKGMTFMAD